MIEIKDIAKLPAPGMNVPYRYEFSPDGNYVSYLWSSKGKLQRDLWLYDLRADVNKCVMDSERGIANNSVFALEQQLARERDRELSLGITNYLWVPDGTFLVVDCGCKLIAISPVDGSTKWSFQHDGPILLPTFSPDGRKLAFVSEGEVWCLFLSQEGSIEIPAQRLTHDATDTNFNGIADQLTWEELGRKRGFWWLPDSKHLIMTTVTTENISPIYILNPDQSAQEIHRYSFAGENVPKTFLSVLNLESGESRKLSIPNNECSYLANVFIHPDGHAFILQLSRNQQELNLIALDLETGNAKPLLLEKGYPWINVSNDITFIKKDGSFIWSHERKGIFQIERRDSDGNLICELAAPEGMVHKIIGVEEERGWVYYIASGLDPRERHIFRSRLDGGEAPEQLTSEPGCHSVVLSPDKQRWIHAYDSISSPPCVTLESLKGEDSLEIIGEKDPSIEALGLRPPELISFLANDQTTILYGALYRPQEDKGNARYPLIVSVYGGPRHQAVQNSWRLTADLRAQHLAQQGYLVLKVDNRGTWGRGHPFEAAVHLKLSQIEVDDQVEGVRYVTEELAVADSERVGVYGWSYGGYMAAMCLAQRPDVFSAAVAGAPVIRWEDYDALYTERYMGMPKNSALYSGTIANLDGYREASVLSHLNNLVGKLLVIHGMKDENVLLRHTMALMEEAARLGKHIDLLILPKERHGVRDYTTRVHVEERLFQYLNAALGRE